MAGLRERHKRERERTILSAAESLFRENGYEATTIAQIGEKANVSAVTVFNYYKTKGELLLALIADENATLLKKLAALVKNNASVTVEEISYKFFCAVTKESLKKVDKKSWRQVISTYTISRNSEFSIAYEDLRNDIKIRFYHILEIRLSNLNNMRENELDTFVDIVYAYHYQLFVDFVADDRKSFAQYARSLRSGLSLLYDRVSS